VTCVKSTSWDMVNALESEEEACIFD
jgi:hypothetical protein